MVKRPGSSARAERAAKKEEASTEQLRGIRRLGRPHIGEQARQLITIRVDPRVIAEFRKEAKRRNVGHQTLINEVLARHVKHVA